MSNPNSLPSSSIKRFASEQFEESPTKRTNVATPGRSYDHSHSGLEQQLVPMISRTETSQYQDYLPDTSYTEDAGEDDDDESKDVFVDAQEAVTRGDSAMKPFVEASAEKYGGESKGIKTKAGHFSVEKLEERKTAEDIEMFEEGGVIELEEMKEDHFQHVGPRKYQEKSKVREIKPETISIASDSDDENEGKDQHSSAETSDAGDEHDNMSRSDAEDGSEEKQDPRPINTTKEDDEQDDADGSEPFDDMFAATFGSNNKSKETICSKDSTTSFSSNNPSRTFTSGLHTTKIHSNPIKTQHPSTPPPPPIRPTQPLRLRPDTRRDLSPSLLRHSKLHSRTQLLIPRLPNHETFPWNRRYWIAVLISGKHPQRSTISEKDFVWMKGNRYSTISTIFHSYALAVMADPEDLALVLGEESVEMRDQVQELDYFNDRLVVLRAVKVKGNERVAGGKSLVQGIIPAGAVISLDLD